MKDLIDRQAAIDAVPRTSVEYICRKNTVSTNPYEHKYHDKFIQFMDDPEISDFGRWQHSNGFNTALVAVECDLDKVPSIEPEQRWIPCSERLPEEKDAGLLKKLGTEKRSGYAIVTVEVKGERMTSTACTHDGKWNWKMKYAFPDYKVVAWMPLPEPYGGDQDDEMGS